jgi:COMPASS component SWD3
LKEWSGEALEREKLVGMWREMMKSVTVVEKEGSAGDSDRKRGSRGRLVELLRQAGAWQVMNARRRGDGPWTLNRSVLPFSVFLLLREG